METKDLMIGDWVYDSNRHECRQIEAADFVQNSDALAPVPLCAEILRDNGFGFIEEDDLAKVTHFYLGEPQYCANMDLHIGCNAKNVYSLNYRGYAVYGLIFVHELQRAFRVCRVPREITLL